jgi:tRNA A37 methylthiotransferase MiaB
MMHITNKFGSGIIFGIGDIAPKYYVECTACMSVWSDFLSWANFGTNKSLLTKDIAKANSVIVLGCQVTDLAILNDIKKAEELHDINPVEIYMGGCLAKRFDIELPSYIKRLDVVRKEYVNIKDVDCIVYAKPFWINEELDKENEYAQGNLFRNMYPLKIGAGCDRHCKYCTIKDTRGNNYSTSAMLQEKEFLSHDNVVLISDNPLPEQIKDWCNISIKYNKPISFRNVEPHNAVICKTELLQLSSLGLLKIFHCPIQSNDIYVLRKMGRDVEATEEYIQFSQLLRKNGTKVATNIIIDYIIDGETYHNMNEEWMNTYFDYWVWNPYFDGNWDYENAVKKFEKYICSKKL